MRGLLVRCGVCSGPRACLYRLCSVCARVCVCACVCACTCKRAEPWQGRPCARAQGRLPAASLSTVVTQSPEDSFVFHGNLPTCSQRDDNQPADLTLELSACSQLLFPVHAPIRGSDGQLSGVPQAGSSRSHSGVSGEQLDSGQVPGKGRPLGGLLAMQQAQPFLGSWGQ